MIEPEVLESVEAQIEKAQMLTEVYQDVPPSARFRKVFYGFFGAIFSGEAEFAPGAEERITNHSRKGGKYSLSIHHPSGFDISIDGAVVNNNPALRPIKDKGVAIAGKAELFIPGLGTLIAWGGARPVFRDKFLYKGLSDEEAKQAKKIFDRDKKKMNTLQNGALVKGVNSGLHHARYEHGTRVEDQHKTGEIRNGTINLFAEVEDPENLMVVTMATNYERELTVPNPVKPWRTKKVWQPWNALTYIDALPAERTPELTVDELQITLQGTVDGARRMREQRMASTT